MYFRTFYANGVAFPVAVEYRDGVATMTIPSFDGKDFEKSAPQAKYSELCARVQSYFEIGEWRDSWDATFSDVQAVEPVVEKPVVEKPEEE